MPQITFHPIGIIHTPFISADKWKISQDIFQIQYYLNICSLYLHL